MVFAQRCICAFCSMQCNFNQPISLCIYYLIDMLFFGLSAMSSPSPIPCRWVIAGNWVRITTHTVAARSVVEPISYIATAASPHTHTHSSLTCLWWCLSIYAALNRFQKQSIEVYIKYTASLLCSAQSVVRCWALPKTRRWSAASDSSSSHLWTRWINIVIGNVQ